MDCGGGDFANRTVLTDLASLGKPGQHFSRDTFSAGSQVTFPQSQAKLIEALSGVSEVSTGLTLTVQHQQGTVPKITATFKTGGQQYQVSGSDRSRQRAADLAKMAACVAKLQASSRAIRHANHTLSKRRQPDRR